MSLILLPPAFFFTVADYLTKEQKEVISQGCGVVKKYQTYLRPGNKNYKKSFERIMLKLAQDKYECHFRLADNLARQNQGNYVCCEFYDRKMNPYMTDSKVITWLD